MDFTSIIGVGASIFTAISLLPQLIKIAREKKAEDVSFGMLITLLIGLILWVCYGVLKKDLIIAISNGVSLLLNLCVSALSIRYKQASTK